MDSGPGPGRVSPWRGVVGEECARVWRMCSGDCRTVREAFEWWLVKFRLGSDLRSWIFFCEKCVFGFFRMGRKCFEKMDEGRND